MHGCMNVFMKRRRMLSYEDEVHAAAIARVSASPAHRMQRDRERERERERRQPYFIRPHASDA